MTFVEKNEENLESLVFALSNRDKTSIAVAIYDTDDTRDKAIAYLGQQVQSQHTLTFDLFGQTTPSLLAFFRDNLPKTATQERPIIHLLRLDPQLFIVVNHKVISSPLVAQINMEREMLFREVDAQVLLWLTREGYNRLRMDAPDFMDWVTAFVFECDDNIAVQPLSFQLPKETIEDRSNATLLQLREKAENLRHRTVKFEQRTKLSTKDAKEYFNLLLALIAAYRDLHDFHQAQTYLQRAYNLAKNHHLTTGFEMGKLLLDWDDTEIDLGNPSMSLSLFDETLQHFTLMGDKHNMLVALSRIGNIHTKLGNYQVALTFFEQYNQIKKELHENYPLNVHVQNNMAICHTELGNYSIPDPNR